MHILGIETSCDETSASVIETHSISTQVLSHVTATSLERHAQTGGIIPEIAARLQIQYIIPVIDSALTKAHLSPSQLNTIAVTVGPGLIGSLLVGIETARTLSLVWGKPIVPVNHLLGHIYANWIDLKKKKNISFPALCLIVSGGHTDLVLIKKHGLIQFLGGTRDDAAGECFDKCARLLGYSYPGGPKISSLAKYGNPKAFALPRPMIGTSDFDFSFSGLKTAFLSVIKKRFPITKNHSNNSTFHWDHIIPEKSTSNKQIIADLCASLEQAIIDTLVFKTVKAAQQYKVASILLGGGVSANSKLRDELQNAIKKRNLPLNLFFPPVEFCTDNAAMIATAAFFNYKEITWKNISADPQLYFD